MTIEIERLLETREMEVQCWSCGSAQRRMVSWVSAHRDTSCSDCGMLIVLNTSSIKAEVMRTRRQLSDLHSQISNVFGAIQAVARPAGASPRPQPKLALGELHSYKSSRRAGPASGPRRHR